MEFITNILKEFNSKQKLFVLILLLIFTSATSIVTTYLNSDYNSCQAIVKENRELLNDYIAISRLIRKQEIPEIQSDSLVIDDAPSSSNDGSGNPECNVMTPMDSIKLITERHLK